MGSQVIAVGAGKGGVGKSFVTANLAITLAKLNSTVCLVDFDLSCANLHSHLGLEPSDLNLSLFFKEGKPVKQLVQKTQIPSVSLIQGFVAGWEPTEVPKQKLVQFLSDLKDLPYSFVLVDLGPGATRENLEVFESAHERILVTTPEPTSIEKTYRFLEALVWKQLQFRVPENLHRSCLNSFEKYRKNSQKTTMSIFESLKNELSLPQLTNETIYPLNQSPVKIVINESRNTNDQQLGQSIQSVCNKFFQLPVSALGHLDYDNSVWQSIRNREPFLVSKPFTPLSGQLLTMAKNLTLKDLHAQILRPAV